MVSDGRAVQVKDGHGEGRPYALLRAGYPYHATLGMRRVTQNPVDIAFGDGGMLFVLCRQRDIGNNIRRINWDDEDLGTFGSGHLEWPVTLLRDRDGVFYVSDEARHSVIMFGPDEEFLSAWGTRGAGPGQFDRPSGMAFDAQEDLYVSDTLNHRVQKLTKDGRYISEFGSFGEGEGQLNMPWGIAVDDEGMILVSDWRNDRVQRFTPEGEFVMSFGSSGSGRGEFSRPSGVEVDMHGDIYVADRGNHRIQLFDPGGRYVWQFTGDATLSKIGRIYIQNNVAALRARETVSTEQERKLLSPASVRIGPDGLMYAPDFGRHRVQVYKKEAYPLSEGQIEPPRKSPTLFTV